jgi:predicted CXXCH cytochrome family protein
MKSGQYSYQHFRLPLVPGKNNFTIVPGWQRLDLNFQQVLADLTPELLDKKVSFFHQGNELPENCQVCHDLDTSKINVTAGIKKQTSCAVCHKNLVDKGTRKHSTTVNQQCLSCHLQPGKPLQIGLPFGKSKDLCFTCHTSKRGWFSRKVIHGPLKFGGCTLCHNPHGQDYPNQLWAEGSLNLCIACHDDQAKLFSEEDRPQFVHGIVTKMGCVVCHDPHAADEEYMLKKPINSLCFSCHPRPASFRHGHPIDGHPVSSEKRDRRTNKRLTCVSCHDPHGSPYSLMLIKPYTGGHLCRVCHH